MRCYGLQSIRNASRIPHQNCRPTAPLAKSWLEERRDGLRPAAKQRSACEPSAEDTHRRDICRSASVKKRPTACACWSWSVLAAPSYPAWAICPRSSSLTSILNLRRAIASTGFASQCDCGSLRDDYVLASFLITSLRSSMNCEAVFAAPF
jgi:hypothetical protein